MVPPRYESLESSMTAKQKEKQNNNANNNNNHDNWYWNGVFNWYYFIRAMVKIIALYIIEIVYIFFIYFFGIEIVEDS